MIILEFLFGCFYMHVSIIELSIIMCSVSQNFNAHKTSFLLVPFLAFIGFSSLHSCLPILLHLVFFLCQIIPILSSILLLLLWPFCCARGCLDALLPRNFDAFSIL